MRFPDKVPLIKGKKRKEHSKELGLNAPFCKIEKEITKLEAKKGMLNA